MVDNFDYDASNEPEFCEACVSGKHHRSPFPVCADTHSKEPLDLIHSDVCGKLNTKLLGGAEYFLTFVDDKTRYVWVYPLKHKDEVFEHFLEWKALVEKSNGLKLKAIHTDNGGEYSSKKFESYFKSEGIRHERTVPKTPVQNGIAERLNRTLVEMVRSVLIDANLPHRFWTEALSTALYLKNRSPSRALEGVTPVEESQKLITCVFLDVMPMPTFQRMKLDLNQRGLFSWNMEMKSKVIDYVVFSCFTRGTLVLV